MNNNSKQLYISIFILTIFSLYQVYFNYGDINKDGVIYLINAQHMINGDYDMVYQTYNWPFFSFLIMIIHKLSGLSLFYSAQFICIFSFIFASTFFLKTIPLISLNKVSPYYGLVILLTSIPIADNYLVMILRDHGFWAGFFLGLYFYLKWLKQNRNLDLFLWVFSLILGTLFRPECLIFLLLFSLTALIYLNHERKKFFIAIILISILSIFIIIFSLNGINFGRLSEFISRPLAVYNNLYNQIPIFSNDFWLSSLLNDYLTSFKFLFFSYVALDKWISGIGFFSIILFFISLRYKLVKEHNHVLIILIISSALIPIFNFYQYYVLSERYFVLSWFIVYLYSSLGLYFIWNKLNDEIIKKYKIKYLVSFYLIISFLIVIIDIQKNNYEREAAEWIKTNIEEIENVYFQSPRVSYYSNFLPMIKYELNDALKNTNFNFFIIENHGSDFETLHKNSNFEVIKNFKNYKNYKSILIYKRK